MRSAWPAFTAFLVALSFTGCSTSGKAPSGTTPAETAPAAPSSIPPSSPAESVLPGASASPGTPGPTSSLRRFLTPSRNIACAIEGEDEVRCDIGKRSFSPPPKPADCEFDWGQSLILDAKNASFVCASDSIYDNGLPVLGYGQTSRVGMIECVSRQEGITCTHLGNRHGFLLSQARYSLF